MSKTSLAVTLAAAVAGTTMLTANAHAHIGLVGAVKDRGGDEKTRACGGVPRSSKPYTYEPGTTIQLKVSENIPHDGYFRIAFDDDGEDFKEPQSIDPVNPNRYGTGKECQGTAADRCGKSDFCNMVSSDGGPTVLWDNLNPHLGGEEGEYSWNVTLPNVECDNCTIQVLQIMEDPLGIAHGPYDGTSDIYFHCVDIVLKKGATGGPGIVTEKPNNKGIDCLASAGGGGSDASVPDVGAGKSDAGMGTASDGGASSTRDAGSTGGGSKPVVEEEDDDDADDAPATGTKVDAGKPSTSKVDASTAKKDAGAADHDDNDDAEESDDEEDGDNTEKGDQPAASDDGCSVSSSSTSTRGLSFALAALLTTAVVSIRRRRSR